MCQRENAFSPKCISLRISTKQHNRARGNRTEEKEEEIKMMLTSGLGDL